MKDARAPLLVAVVLLVLPLLYVGSYLALVQQAAVIVTLPGSPPLTAHVSEYRFGGRYATAFYRPLEKLDRKLRPGTWGQLDVSR